jgi:non-specific serine/threonine protein kinase
MQDPRPAAAGERVRQVRLRLGLSQIELARLLDVSNVTVNRWERGRVLPGPTMIRRIEELDRDFRPAGRLPVPSTAFVGRSRELADVPRLLDEARVLTLVGPPGCGKTRLAVEVATRLTDRFHGEVWFVDLAPAPRESDVAPRVAMAIGVLPAAMTPPVDRLTEALANRPTLLVLDNCEHVLRSCRILLDRLLPVCADLRVLATSRAPLLLAAETVLPLPPLPVPPADADTDQIARADAVALFALRARRSRPDFALTPAAARQAATICRRLDGLPLAIELAAARLSVLSVAQIADRLSDRFALLRGERSAVASRQRTLAAAIDWSYGLLDGAEQRLFGQLAVFAGPFDLDAIEAICGSPAAEEAEGGLPPSASILDLLSALVAQSLVSVETGPDAEAPVRYRLLESLREYAAGTIGGAEEATLRRRHAAYYLERAQRAAAEFSGPAQPAALRRLLADDDNLHAALAWAIAASEGAIAVPLAAALWRFWHSRGRYAEGTAAIEAALTCGGAIPRRRGRPQPAGRPSPRSATAPARPGRSIWPAWLPSGWPTTRGLGSSTKRRSPSARPSTNRAD